MLYVADIAVADSELVERMTRMRAWLDHRRLEPTSFRFQRSGDQQIIRVCFKAEHEAAEFVEEFGAFSRSAPRRIEAIAGPL